MRRNVFSAEMSAAGLGSAGAGIAGPFNGTILSPGDDPLVITVGALNVYAAATAGPMNLNQSGLVLPALAGLPVFVQGVVGSTVDSAIVQAVIDLADAMDIATVAEGVETRDQVAKLSRLGCDMAQGYYFSPPLRAGDFDAELARHFTPAAAPSAPAVSLPAGAA